jgi:hypothetical protein
VTGESRFAENIMHFGRVLRAAGLRVGPGQVIDALRAVEVAGLRRRDDFYWTLRAIFVNRREHLEMFDQAFHVFWRNPKMLDQLLSLMLPRLAAGAERAVAGRRLADALAGGEDRQAPRGDERIEVDAALTYSARESLRTMDFETMSAAELAQAKKIIAGMRLPLPTVPTRRWRTTANGPKVDLRATLRASLRGGAASIPLKRRAVVERHPPLVILCDISGSMACYSRMFLHFVHALTNDRDRVYTFVFGTRLTDISRHLRHRDIDLAMARVGRAVVDWSGGTRIGAALGDFNLKWSRRVLGQGALVLLISDGLDRDGGAGLDREMDRLHRSCRRLVWLNPLLRWDGFEAKPTGIRIMLPHVDEFRPMHNLTSLNDLALALSMPAARRQEGVREVGRNVAGPA